MTVAMHGAVEEVEEGGVGEVAARIGWGMMGEGSVWQGDAEAGVRREREEGWQRIYLGHTK